METLRLVVPAAPRRRGQKHKACPQLAAVNAHLLGLMAMVNINTRFFTTRSWANQVRVVLWQLLQLDATVHQRLQVHATVDMCTVYAGLEFRTSIRTLFTNALIISSNAFAS